MVQLHKLNISMYKKKKRPTDPQIIIFAKFHPYYNVSNTVESKYLLTTKYDALQFRQPVITTPLFHIRFHLQGLTFTFVSLYNSSQSLVDTEFIDIAFTHSRR